ncbi:MAG: hypothetical protein ACJAXR_000588 [Halopseudomonas sp.]|jgi:hypothetical protein
MGCGISLWVNGSKGRFEVVGSDDELNISQVDCYSKALSTYFEFSLDDEGEFTDAAKYTKGDVVIIDIGGSTNDVV